MQEALVKNLEMLLGDAIEEIIELVQIIDSTGQAVEKKGITMTLGGNF